MNFVRASDKYANLLPFAFRHGVSNGTFEKNDVQSDRSTTFLSINFEPIRVLTTILSAFNSRFFQRLANFFLPVPYDKTNYLIFFFDEYKLYFLFANNFLHISKSFDVSIEIKRTIW